MSELSSHAMQSLTAVHTVTVQPCLNASDEISGIRNNKSFGLSS